ncbi:MAG: ARMT1-like domain-containing protein [Thermodesulfobacteriota bacterium]|nr:ARMT1-like domain-containing protein [Thermodesulfobacteriota bacterium]
MQTYPECIPCFLKQAVEVSRIINASLDLSIKIMSRVLKETAFITWEVSPPENFRNIFRIIKKVSKNNDPYLELKREYNDKAWKLYPKLKQLVEDSNNPLEMAAKLAIAGNIIDFGTQSKIADLEEVVRETISKPLAIDDFYLFSKSLEESKNILYLADNCGEIIFDRILLEEITKIKSYNIFFIVRGAPALNDVLAEDAHWAGINRFAHIISNGSDAPATILPKCTEKVRELFNETDIIISKGQGNFEALEDEDKPLFFMLKAKCNVVADYLKVCIGDSMLLKNTVEK